MRRLPAFFAALLLVVISLVALTMAARADEPRFSIESLATAKHYGGVGYDFNGLLNGTGLLVPLDPSGNLQAVALHYTNSFFRSTNVLGVEDMPFRLGSVRFGGMAGISNWNAYPASPIRPLIVAGEALIPLGSRTDLNVVVVPCGGGAWCNFALAIGLRQGIGLRR